jgi:hypothetical protein
MSLLKRRHEELVLDHAFRRDIEESHRLDAAAAAAAAAAAIAAAGPVAGAPGFEVVEDVPSLILRGLRREGNRGARLKRVHIQHLVLDQGNQGRNDQRDPALQKSRQLEAEALATAAPHNDECVERGASAVDNLKLAPTERWHLEDCLQLVRSARPFEVANTPVLSGCSAASPRYYFADSFQILLRPLLLGHQPLDLPLQRPLL